MTEKHEVGCPCDLGGTSVLFTSIEVAEYVAICLQVYSTGAAEDLGSIPGSGRSPRGGHGNPLQYSGLENPMDRGDQQATVHGVTMNRTRLSDLACTQECPGAQNECVMLFAIKTKKKWHGQSYVTAKEIMV